MLLKESELDDQDIIYTILGKPYKEPGKLLTVTGSAMYFVKECTDLEGNPLPLKRDRMKAIFQRYEKGLMLLFNGSNYRNGILISEKSIQKITLTKLIEERDIWNHFFLKSLAIISDVPVLGWITFLFRYKTRETVLSIRTDFFETRMITSFSSFDSQRKYFVNLGIEDRLQIII